MLNTGSGFCLVSAALLMASCVDSTRTAPDFPPSGVGTVREDLNGRITGTGWKYYYYPDGKAIKAEDAYVSDKLIYSAWLKPDGTIVAEQKWFDGTGTQYYLRDDGSIAVTMPMVNGVANGTATYFNQDGSIEKKVNFKMGKPITESGTLPGFR